RGRVLRLGRGGGIPGRGVATHRPELKLTLLEASERACRFLREAVVEHGWNDVTVIEARPEEAARRSDLRETYDAVVARSFGPPPVTAECAVGFLRPGGQLVVSEPPDDGGTARWPSEDLPALGLSPPVRHEEQGGTFVV